MRYPLVEICCGDIESVVAARQGGADRIELCSALAAGGLTPSAGMIETAVTVGVPEVNVLIRPREGDFLYSDAETQVMLRDIRQSAEAGANGVVIGALNADGTIATGTCRRLIEMARDHGLSVTFHRAFDQCSNPLRSLEEIIDLGCDRLLTSGQASSALIGAELIGSLQRHAGSRIIIMAGAGITPDNAAEVIRATGVSEIHASAKTTTESQMAFRISKVTMGRDDVDDYSRQVTSADTVARLASIIHNISKA